MSKSGENPEEITVAPITTNDRLQKRSESIPSLASNGNKKKKSAGKSIANFLYNPKRKTVFGRDSLNWAKLSIFYSVFYFFLGCFFVILLYIFASILDRSRPRYYNTESTMAVRSPTAVVGMGFRPQPSIDSSLIEISSDLTQQKRIASSLRLFRDVYLIQGADANTEVCSEKNPASDLPENTACEFDWLKVVPDQNHPCSDNNLYGFKYERPCVLVKLNKVYGWTPTVGHLPREIQQLRGVHSNKSVANSDVYITCAGTNVADNDVLTDIKYYSVVNPSGSSKYGVIPNYYFPYRNAKDHVQPFILVQFNKLPANRLVSVTCRALAPGIEHSTRGMRGMVAFQLYRANNIYNQGSEEEEK